MSVDLHFRKESAYEYAVMRKSELGNLLATIRDTSAWGWKVVTQVAWFDSGGLRAIADKLDELNGVASIPQRASPASVRQIEAQSKQVASELNRVEKGKE